MSRSSRGAELTLVLLTANWGFTFVTVKDALVHADPFTFLALRFALGAVVLLPWAWPGFRNAKTLRHGLMLGVLLFFGFAFQTWGLVVTTPARSAFITGLCVVIVPLVEWLLFRKVVPWAGWVAVAIAVCGLYLLNGGAGQRATWVGDLLTLGCAIAYAFHISLTARFAPGARVSTLVAVQLGVVAVGALALLPFAHPHVAFTQGFVAAVVFTGVVASAVAITLQSWAQVRTTAVRAAVIFTLEPLFALLASAVILRRETFGPLELFGGALLIVGVLCAELGTPFWRWLRSLGGAGGGSPARR
ncbi:MAG: DMT family transporter [Myxococcaceae bacterium]